MLATAEKPMVRRNDVSVKLDADVVRKAKIVAAIKDMTIAQYLSDILAEKVEQDLTVD